ncbi:hypothetical protein GCM10010277_62640 [Streptomyces longisporoflavus]|nr:hypothetical protein GCM10010277_62640 [Streptomyces longisporoflavus]
MSAVRMSPPHPPGIFFFGGGVGAGGGAPSERHGLSVARRGGTGLLISGRYDTNMGWAPARIRTGNDREHP